MLPASGDASSRWESLSESASPLLELFRNTAALPLFRKVILPASLPSIFVGLRLSAALSVLAGLSLNGAFSLLERRVTSWRPANNQAR